MRYQHTLLFLAFVLLCNVVAFSQSKKSEFKVVDDYVKSLGPLDTLNMGTISFIVTKKFPDPKDKVRAIFDWIAYNISFDLKAARNNDNEKNFTELILKSRKAKAAGYAALFQDMCSAIKIRCLTVDGYVKYTTEQINEKLETFNHTWAVVQLGQSPETWFYVDPTWGTGFTDDRLTKFTKFYNDDYFFADRTIFNYQHFPDNGAWLLGQGTKSLANFITWPLVKSAAYEFKMGKYFPATGLIKTQLNKPVPFSININTDAKIEIVSLVIGDDKKKKTKTVDYNISGNNISFNYKFDNEDTYPITVLINNKPVLSYMVEVVEK